MMDVLFGREKGLMTDTLASIVQGGGCDQDVLTDDSLNQNWFNDPSVDGASHTSCFAFSVNLSELVEVRFVHLDANFIIR